MCAMVFHRLCIFWKIFLIRCLARGFMTHKRQSIAAATTTAACIAIPYCDRWTPNASMRPMDSMNFEWRRSPRRDMLENEHALFACHVINYAFTDVFNAIISKWCILRLQSKCDFSCVRERSHRLHRPSYWKCKYIERMNFNKMRHFDSLQRCESQHASDEIPLVQPDDAIFSAVNKTECWH